MNQPLRLPIPTIAITGSAGKTTTKEMIASVLQVKWNIFKSEKNRNDRYHTAQHAKMIQPWHEAVVLEFGMARSSSGIAHCKHIEPNIGIITSVGTAHFGKLGNDLMTVASSKSALIQHMKPDGLLLVNQDDEHSKLLKTKEFQGRIITVGIQNHSDYQAHHIKYTDNGMLFEVQLNGIFEHFTIPSLGSHNVINALFAIAVSDKLQFTPSEIRQGLQSYRVPPRRLNLLKLTGDSFLIDDTFSANVQAMKAAIDVLAEMGKHKKKIAVLGSMLELGKYSPQMHEEIGRYLLSKQIDIVLTLGEEAKQIHKGFLNKCSSSEILHFENHNLLHEYLKYQMQTNIAVLVKGSHRMRMDQTVKYIYNQWMP